MARDLELMRLHVEALYTRDADGRLERVNEPNGAPAPRFFLGRTADGVVRGFRRDVDDATRRELEAASDDEMRGGLDAAAPIDPVPYEAILARSAPVTRTETGPAFVFPRELAPAGDAVRVTEANAEILRRHMPAWLPDVLVGQPLFAVTVDGHAVAVCATVRRTAAATEAGVETIAAFRGRGYAPRVATAWARAVRAMRVVPLYSTSWRNAASRGVARKLGLLQFGSDLHIA